MRAILEECAQHTFSTFDRQKLFIVLTFLFPFFSAVVCLPAPLSVCMHKTCIISRSSEMGRRPTLYEIEKIWPKHFFFLHCPIHSRPIFYRTEKKTRESKMYKHKFCNNMRVAVELCAKTEKYTENHRRRENFFRFFFPSIQHEDIIFDKIWDSGCSFSHSHSLLASVLACCEWEIYAEYWQRMPRS